MRIALLSSNWGQKQAEAFSGLIKVLSACVVAVRFKATHVFQTSILSQMTYQFIFSLVDLSNFCFSSIGNYST